MQGERMSAANLGLRLALLGNPNCGKTALFNLLTVPISRCPIRRSRRCVYSSRFDRPAAGGPPGRNVRLAGGGAQAVLPSSTCSVSASSSRRP
ncbi:MAG: hypothetical protein IPK02_09690 [Candidatus Accumulibacter sp.]|uniref:FeoB-type G domain-containing protein n=1 Tax=Candidatus Accumulibacter affinis TaxID=2954384 RepID=A0A935TB39_9PROT|nr:hypothetical protein [Candidatus Accumulibacter affinis]